jgi:hypothetical protein
MNLPDIPKYVADYFNFAIDFIQHPGKALKEYKANNRIHETLITYTAIGIFFSWLTGILLQKLAAVNNDKSEVVKVFGKADIDILPFIGLFGIILFAVILHFGIKLVLLFKPKATRPKAEDIRAEGSINIKNSINGALAYFSVIPFLLMFLFLVLMLVVYPLKTKISLVLLIVLELPIIITAFISFIWHFPKAMSTVHPDYLGPTVRNSIYTLFGIIMVFIAIVS